METIHPNDIMTLDMTKVSYVTLKDGSMIVIDDSVPEKGNKGKKDIPSVSNESKLPKEIKLEISSPSTLSFKGNTNNNKCKSNFKICNQIIKNTNFSFFGKKFESKSSFKSNSDSHSNIDSNKENKDLNNKNNISSTTLKSILKNNNNINNNENHFFKSLQNEPNNNNENDINIIKTEKSDMNQSNINTNLSNPLLNYMSNNQENQDTANSNLSRRKSRASRIFNTGILNRKNRIQINAVCTLSIRAEDKHNINIINQYNSLVDKLNAERDKKPLYHINDFNQDKNSFRYYDYYKNKTSLIKKSMNTLNQNFQFDKNKNLNNGNYEENKYKTINDYNKKHENYLYNSLGRNKKFYRQNSGTSLRNRAFKSRITKYSSSDLVLPSNKMIHL